MVSMIYYAFASIVMMVFALFVGVPMPFSVPPLPEDPALLRIAPQDSLCAFTWSGSAAADPKSKNATERLCAEPEVREFAAALLQGAQSMIKANTGATGGLARSALDLVVTALQKPGCVFLRDLKPETRQLQAGIAVHLGEDTRPARALIDVLTIAMKASLRAGQPRHEDLEIDDVRFRALPVEASRSFLGWAEVDGWVLVAIGDGTAEAMLAGLRDKSQGLRGTADCQRLLAATAVARPATRMFADGRRLLAAIRSSGGSRPTAILEALGLASAGAMFATTGLDGDGYAARAQVDLAARQGLLGAFAGEPIGQDTLLPVPADADLAIAAHVEPAALEAALLEFVRATGGGDVKSEYEAFQAEFAQHLHVEWQRDLVAHLDGQLAVWDAPSQGGFGFTAAAGTIGLRDGAAFGTAWKKLMGAWSEQVPDKATKRRQDRLQRNDSFLETFEYGGQTLHWIDVFDDDMPFPITFGALPATFVAGLTPQSARSTIDAIAAPNPDQSLLRWPSLNKRGRATALAYVDTRSLLQQSWPFASMWLQAVGNEWQREGFDLDAADLPRPAALLRHCGRELSLLEPDKSGFAFTHTGNLPVLDPITALVIGAAVTLLN